MKTQIIICWLLLSLLDLNAQAQLVTKKYENGTKQSEGMMVAGKKEGEWKTYHENGQLASVGPYVKDSMNGAWLFYYDNGQVLARVTYKMSDGKNLSSISGLSLNSRDGYLITYYNTGKRWQEQTWKNGAYNGYFASYFKSGQKEYVGYYNKGVKDSLWIYYFENGNTWKEHSYKNEEYNGAYKEWNTEGILLLDCNLKDGKRDGLYKTFHDSAGVKKVECSFVRGDLSGIYREWDKTGVLMEECNYKNGRRDGVCTEYFELTGKKNKETGYLEGEENGPYRVWNEAGLLIVEGEYDFGNQIGKWTEWYDNGQKESEGKYREDMEEGLWTKWYEDGKKASEGMRRKGSYIGDWVEWDEDGSRTEKHYNQAGDLTGLVTYYYPNGSKMCELKADEDINYYGMPHVLNAWDDKGKQTLKDGDGKLFEYYPNGEIAKEENYKKGYATGYTYEYLYGGLIKNVTYTEPNLFMSDGYPGIENSNYSEISVDERAITTYRKMVKDFFSNAKWTTAPAGFKYVIFNDTLDATPGTDSIFRCRKIFWLDDGEYLEDNFLQRTSRVVLTPTNARDPFVKALQLFKKGQSGLVWFSQQQIESSNYLPSDYRKKGIIVYIDLKERDEY